MRARSHHDRASGRIAWALAASVLGSAGSVLIAEDAPGSWTQWGGPGQTFRAHSKGLASEWPETGPREIWSRPLGDGYSSVLVEEGRLYTMYRDGSEEVVVALDAKTGGTVWEHRYDASPRDGHVTQFGEGPRATPLLAGDRIFTIGVSGDMNALDKKTGKVAWSHDLWDDFGGNFLNHGYSSSPIEHGDNVIALVGGEGQSIVAFDKKSGEVAWKALDFQNSYSTPRLLKIGDDLQLVTFMATELIGIDPDDGSLLWSYDHENQWRQNINMPTLAADGDVLFMSSPEAGARGLRIVEGEDGTKVEQVWSTRKIQFYHVSTVSDGKWVYGSTGTRSPAFMSAVNIQTGEIAWRKRGFAKANVIWADGRLIILDEEGKLSLATASPEDLTVHSEHELFDQVAWTPPTVVGTVLYVRDNEKIVALDLG